MNERITSVAFPPDLDEMGRPFMTIRRGMGEEAEHERYPFSGTAAAIFLELVRTANGGNVEDHTGLGAFLDRLQEAPEKVEGANAATVTDAVEYFRNRMRQRAANAG